MRKLFISMSLLFVASMVLAEPQYVPIACRLDPTNSAKIMTATVNPHGYIMEVYIDTPLTNGAPVATALFTGAVTVVVFPDVGNALTNVVLYTNSALSAAQFSRPRIIPTDSAGAALSSLTIAEPYLCCGDDVVLRVTQASTLTNKAVISGWLKLETK